MKKQINKQTIINFTIILAFAVIFIVLLAQYISIAQLNSRKAKLDAELKSTTGQYKKLNDEYQNISDNYDDYVESYVRDNYDYVEDGDVLINKDWTLNKTIIKKWKICVFHFFNNKIKRKNYCFFIKHWKFIKQMFYNYSKFENF